MGHLIGRRGYSRETYPLAQGAASGASRNRNVSVPETLVAPFTPATGGPGSLVAAILYTPQVSGVIQVSALLGVSNGASPDTYELGMAIFSGTGLTVTGGSVTSNGWVMGTTVPPVVGGSGVALAQLIGVSVNTLPANASGDFAIGAAISQPLPVGIPVVIELLLLEVGGGNSLSAVAFSSLSVLELP